LQQFNNDSLIEMLQEYRRLDLKTQYK